MRCRFFVSLPDNVKYSFHSYLIEQKRLGKKITAYGAAAKGNMFLNYCRVKGTDLIYFVVYVSPHKQGISLPGSHIPIVSEQKIKDEKSDIIVILPWNIKGDIFDQFSYIRKRCCESVLGIPELKKMIFGLKISIS